MGYVGQAPAAAGVTSADITDLAIVNADVNASAAIDYSKLAALSDGNILVGNGSNVATSVNPSGDVDVSNAGVFSIAATAVDTAHIGDNQVTVAKLADIARGSLIIGNASAASAELTKGGAATVLTSDGTDIAWAAGGGGIDTAEQWRVSTDQAIDSTISGDNGAVIDNWERNDTTGSGAILDGSGITVSSGVFTFPSTGIWMVQMIPQYTGAGGPGIVLETCDDYSTGPTWAAQFYRSLDTAFSYSILYNAWLLPMLFFDVTDVAEDKLQFLVGSAGSNGTLKGDSAGNETVAYFIRLGDT
jgi:hypothetical protein